MAKLNPHFASLEESYLFATIAEKKESAVRTDLLNLGIGDISRPLPKVSVKALKMAADEMGKKAIGYGPANGYLFLREKLATDVDPDEIFISDGAKRDTADLAALFDGDITVGLCDPVYPVYRDANLLLGRKITYLPCTEANHFMPQVPDHPLDLIYLCSPHNPTGAALSYEALEEWVAYAKKHDSIIIFDAAYAPFVQNAPKSIYEIPGARDVAIEVGSFSKGARFTGLRCAWSIIPKAIQDGALHKAWTRRQAIHTNGVSYPVQKAAAAALSIEGQKEIAESTGEIMHNAMKLKKGLEELGWKCFGGEECPYIWCKAGPSWEVFDHLLSNYGIVCTPGSGFGSEGEGYVRFSAFSPNEVIEEALGRLQKEPIHAV